MKFFLQIHHYTVHVKIMQVAPSILIITTLRGIKITGGKLHQINIHIQLVTCNKRHMILHRAHYHPSHYEDAQVTPTMQQGKVPKTKMRGKMRSKQHSPKIVTAEFVHMETLIKESPEAKQSRKRKENQDPEIPIKPNRKTRDQGQHIINSGVYKKNTWQRV
jgi:hypothetical protein